MTRYDRLGALCLSGTLLAACGGGADDAASREEEAALDERLVEMLADRSFTGRIEETLEARLGRPVDPRLAELGRLLFFDPVLSLTGDNSCSGCHGPNVSFNDSRPIAIGVGNNGIVGPDRRGPHNFRRAPTLLNAAFYPRLMWDSRFAAESLDPFDNTRGFTFPEPEGTSLSGMDHLLAAMAFTPVVAREEMAGFDFAGSHDEMRAEVVRRVAGVDGYRASFAEAFPEVARGAPVGFPHIARALTEFQLTLVRADAPIDAYARGDRSALTAGQKRGAISFFGRAMCGECHITGLYASEMFSDFDTHVLGVPQLAPAETNVDFDGPDRNEDYGYERISGLERDRYEFRTSPLRNVAFQPSFMHNGAYECLDDAIRHHLRITEALDGFRGPDLGPSSPRGSGPVEPVLARLHDLVRNPPDQSDQQLRDIVDFVEHGLSDPDAHPDRLRSLVPESVPSGLPVHDFQFDAPAADCSR